MKVFLNIRTSVCFALILVGAAWLATPSLYATTPQSTDRTPITGGTSYGTAVTVSPNIDYSGIVSTSHTVDYYQINVTPSQQITITFGSAVNFNRASFSAYDQQHVSALYSKFVFGAEETYNFQYVGNGSTPNKYYFVVESQGGLNQYQFQIALSDPRDGGQAGDAGDDFESARVLSPQADAATNFVALQGGADVDDWFRINSLPGQMISLTIKALDYNNEPNRLYMTLVDQGNIRLWGDYDDAPIKLAKSVIYLGNNSVPSAYLLHLANNGGAGKLVRYKIDIQLMPQSDASQPSDAGDSFDSARLITPTVGTSTAYVGVQGGADVNDWLRINSLPGQIFSLTITPLDYNNSTNRLYMTVVDQANVRLWSDYVDTPNKQAKSATYLGNNSVPSAYLLHLESGSGAGRLLTYKIDILLAQQSDANQSGDAGDEFDTARLIGPDLDSSTSRIGSSDDDDYYRIDLPIATGDKRPYTFTLDTVPWPANASGRLYLTLYKANRAQSTSKYIDAPLTDPLTLDLSDCDLCYVKVSHSNNVPVLRYFFKLAGAAKPSGTPTPGATPPPIVNITPPPPTATPAVSFEPNNDCGQAISIPSDGQEQLHLFEQPGDKDWLKFDVVASNKYAIEVNIPPGSQTDVEIELYPACDQTASQVQNLAYTFGARLEFQATTSGTIFLRLTNNGTATSGVSTLYHVAVRNLSASNTQGALIIVAGRLRMNDPVQRNIDSIAEQVYALFQKQNYPPERIQFLTTKATSAGRTGAPSKASLQAVITTWAVDKVAGGRPLTFYIVDHGDPGKVYLDKPNGEWVTPDELNGWLNQLETAAPGIKINVVIEACNSGSFLIPPAQVQSAVLAGLSKSGRVVITSAGQQNLAYVTSSGAIFSDNFLQGLGNGSSLWTSFSGGRWAAEQAKSGQTPYLDANGNSIPNEKEDEVIAAQRGFAFAGTLVGEEWSPLIATVAVQTQVIAGNAEVRAEVRDDVAVNRVWIMVYPPGYTAPQTGNELVQQIGAAGVGSAILVPLGNGQYAINYVGFDQPGTYKVVVYAEDNQGNEARPVSFDLVSGDGAGGGMKVYLPVATK